MSKALLFPLFVCLCVIWICPTTSQGDSSTQTVSVASFNIQIFGLKKMENKLVVDTIIKILNKYDFISIQEIRDTTETAFGDLMKRLTDRTNKPYKYVVGPRLGRTNSKEQYAFIYDSTKISFVKSSTYADPNGKFERPPLSGLFKINGVEVFFVNVHTKPESAPDEIDNLVNVFDDAKLQFGVSNGIIMGDFNAGCGYVPKYKWASIRLRTLSRFKWLIGDDADTTVNISECPYDRFVISGDWILTSMGKSEPFDFQQAYSMALETALLVSDHYPIATTMSITSQPLKPKSDPVDRYVTPSVPSSDNNGPNVPLIVGATFAGLALLVSLIVFTVCWRRRQQKQNQNRYINMNSVEKGEKSLQTIE